MNTETPMSELPATELEAIKQRWRPAGSYEVYENYEGGIEILDAQNRRSWENINAYDSKDEKVRSAEAMVESLNDIPKLLTEIERLRKLAELWSGERAELEAKLNIRGPFKAAQPQVYFFCEWAVYKKDAVSSMCYTTSKEVADWIASRLNERDTLTAELASAKADTARLDWWDREKPLAHNELRTGHIVLAMEYGCAEGPTIRQAIDAALRPAVNGKVGSES